MPVSFVQTIVWHVPKAHRSRKQDLFDVEAWTSHIFRCTTAVCPCFLALSEDLNARKYSIYCRIKPQILHRPPSKKPLQKSQNFREFTTKCPHVTAGSFLHICCKFLPQAKFPRLPYSWFQGFVWLEITDWFPTRVTVAKEKFFVAYFLCSFLQETKFDVAFFLTSRSWDH